MTEDLFGNKPAPRPGNTRKPGQAGVRKTKRMGQAFKRMMRELDDPNTTHDERMELLRMADKLARK
jgi:hypothetical protein